MTSSGNEELIQVFGRTLQYDPLNNIRQVDNNTVYITPRFNKTGLIELKIGILMPFSQKDDKLTEDIVWGGSSAIRMAVNEINAAHLISGAYITLIEKDSFPDASVDQAAVTNAVYALVTLLQQGVIGVIGDVTSSWTALSALMTSALELPQCSFTASAVSFSDKSQFKYFFRTIPTDVVMIDAMLSFVIHEGWTKVGVIYTDDSLGQQLYQRTIQQTEQLNIQLVNYQSFSSTTSTPTSPDMKGSLDALLDSGVRVIIVAASAQAQSYLMVQAAVSGYLSAQYVWLLVDDNVAYYLDDAITMYNNAIMANSANGTAQRPLSLQSDFNGLFYFSNLLTLDGYPPYDSFISKWSQLDSKMYPYAGSMNISTNEGLAYSCMMMMANGFQMATKKTTNATDGLLQLASGNRGSSLTPEAFNVGYVGPDGPMQLDANGDRMSGNFRIVNYQHGVPVAIGQSVVGNLTLFSSPMFADGTYNIPLDSPPSVALNPGLTSAISFAILIISAIGSLFAIAMFFVVIIHRKNEIFKASSPLFCCFELIGFVLTYSSVVMMIGVPSQTTCLLMPLSFNIGFLLVISNMIAKNYRIYRIFNNVFIRRTVITDFQLIKSVSVMMGVDLIILVAGLLVIKPNPEKIGVSLTRYYWSCDMEHPHKITFAALLGTYCALLLILATFLAYKTRLAGKHYNRYSECRQMGLSIYNIFFSALVAFAVLVNPMADYYTKYYISVVTVLWATTFSLLILFLPKLQAFIQQRRQTQEKEKEKISAMASQLVIAATSATVGLHKVQGECLSPQHQYQHHRTSYQPQLAEMATQPRRQSRLKPADSPSSFDDATELLSLEEILESNAPVIRSQQGKFGSFSYQCDHRGSDDAAYLEYLGCNHGSFVEVYEADVPARKTIRYFPFLSQWEMLHIMVFPWLGYFSYISKRSKQGRVMAYQHATIHTAELENYVLKIHGQGIYNMYIQVPDLKTLALWERRMNQRHISPSDLQVCSDQQKPQDQVNDMIDTSSLMSSGAAMGSTTGSSSASSTSPPRTSLRTGITGPAASKVILSDKDKSTSSFRRSPTGAPLEREQLSAPMTRHHLDIPSVKHHDYRQQNNGLKEDCHPSSHQQEKGEAVITDYESHMLATGQAVNIERSHPLRNSSSPSSSENLASSASYSASSTMVSPSLNNPN